MIPSPSRDVWFTLMVEASIFADRDQARGLNHTLDMIQPPTYSLASGLCLCQCPQLPRGVTRVKHLISSYLVVWRLNRGTRSLRAVSISKYWKVFKNSLRAHFSLTFGLLLYRLSISWISCNAKEDCCVIIVSLVKR